MSIISGDFLTRYGLPVFLFVSFCLGLILFLLTSKGTMPTMSAVNLASCPPATPAALDAPVPSAACFGGCLVLIC